MQKEAARQLVAEIHARRTRAEVLKASWRVVHIVRTKLNKTRVLTALLYKPVEEWGELDLTTLPDMLPHIRYDFVEKERNAEFPSSAYDVIFLPLHGFSKDGYRLGHGGGWYDRFLSTQAHAFKIGIGFEDTLVDFPTETHDVRLDCIITDKHLRNFGKMSV